MEVTASHGTVVLFCSVYFLFLHVMYSGGDSAICGFKKKKSALVMFLSTGNYSSEANVCINPNSQNLNSNYSS